MKDLFLIRHGEAVSDDMDLKDKDRPLTGDGRVAASKAGKMLNAAGHIPDKVLSSSSLRTEQTTGFIIEQLSFNPTNVVYLDDLYEASTRIMIRVINELDEVHHKVFLIAHNPAITYLAEHITGNVIGNVAPAGIVHLQFDGKWSEIAQNNADLVNYHHPKTFS